MLRGNAGGDKPSPGANSLCMGPQCTVCALRAGSTPTLYSAEDPHLPSIPYPPLLRP